MNKTERIPAKAYLAQQAAKKGNAKPTSPPPALVPTGNLFPSIRPDMYLGIDPGVHNGFALWQARKGAVAGQFVEVNTLDFVATVRRLEKLKREFGPAALRVRIENPNGNLPTFDKGVAPTLANIKIREKMAQNVGSNKRSAELLIAFLDELGIPYDAIVPQGGSSKKGKITAAYFAGVKGFPTRCNQHERDACALVINL